MIVCGTQSPNDSSLFSTVEVYLQVGEIHYYLDVGIFEVGYESGNFLLTINYR